jgi:hypothetical protein
VPHGGAQIAALEPEPCDGGQLVAGAEVHRLHAGDAGVDGGVGVADRALLADRGKMLNAEFANADQEGE